VFSVALSVSGDIFAWGSNNNGQMGLGTETASDSSNRSSSKATQLNLPTKVELGRENASGQVKQVLAGDCHVLAADDAGIYAWGQGQILEEDSKSEKYFLDVICNQPVQIEAEIENEMYYQIDRSEEELLADESRDGPASAGQRTR
jgi:alpha-tubulin suppressor-like RCC1 family protein